MYANEGRASMQSSAGFEDDDHPALLGPFFTIVSGLALAIAAVVGLGGPPDLSPSRGASQAAQAPIDARPAGPGRLLVYLVATEEDRRALQHDIATDRQWFTESYAGKTTDIRVLVLAEEQEESLETLAVLLPEASLGTGLGPEVKLVDMR
jgi:hypothetical protein